MKKLVLSLFLPLCFFTAKAVPLYTLSPGDTLIGTVAYNSMNALQIYQNNSTVGYINLAWERVSMNIPSGWDYSLCDYTNCYVGIPASGTMTPLPANCSAFLTMNINPYAIDGTAIIRMYVHDVNDSTNGDTLTWILSTPLGINSPSAAAFSFFPNPAKDFLAIRTEKQGEFSATVLDATGKVISMQQLVASAEIRLDVSMLPEGVYFIRLEDAEGAISTQRFVRTDR